MSVKIKIQLHCSEDFVKYPLYVVWELSRENFNKIKEINKFIIDKDLNSATGKLFDSITYYDSDEDYEKEIESEISIDDSLIGIYNNTCIYFEASIYDDDSCKLNSDGISLSYLERILNVSEEPIKHMPLYINDEDENIRNIAIERLSYKP